MNIRLGRGLIAAAVLLAQASPAEAHIVAARLGDFYAGALHPLTDLQDVILWGAMGVLGGTLGAARGRWLVLVFPLGLLAGLALGQDFEITLTGSTVDAGMVLVLGLLLATAVRIPTVALCALAFALAVIRGMANATDLGPETDRLLFAAGLACSGYAVITLVMALVLAFRGADTSVPTSWRKITLQALGGWIAAIGLMMVGYSLAS
ncbi:HupE/UreJ family protein [Bradyrhizobium sp. Ai1a-2]|uniref:HupE/UreJ family protein n=1 Tax=Bradyrhizobium sp. Ai1a-2 TaxID=196490 RepID=UPI00041DAD20|nr:HupE/UreJ family protein [Bradyrhizobium sp. Ai1a-2]